MPTQTDERDGRFRVSVHPRISLRPLWSCFECCGQLPATELPSASATRPLQAPGDNPRPPATARPPSGKPPAHGCGRCAAGKSSPFRSRRPIPSDSPASCARTPPGPPRASPVSPKSFLARRENPADTVRARALSRSRRSPFPCLLRSSRVSRAASTPRRTTDPCRAPVAASRARLENHSLLRRRLPPAPDASLPADSPWPCVHSPTRPRTQLGSSEPTPPPPRIDTPARAEKVFRSRLASHRLLSRSRSLLVAVI